MGELTAEEKEFLVNYCMESSKNIWLALAIGQIQSDLEKEIVSSFVKEKEKEFLVNYCTEPENRELALAIGQIQSDLKREIVSSFVKELDTSVKRELKDRGLHWKTSVPETDLEAEGGNAIYVMTTRTMSKRRIEIHLSLWNGEELYVGTPKKKAWPKNVFTDFKDENESIWEDSLSHRQWYFCPTEGHRYIETIESLSTLNECLEITYFTDELVRFAESISRILWRIENGQRHEL